MSYSEISSGLGLYDWITRVIPGSIISLSVVVLSVDTENLEQLYQFDRSVIVFLIFSIIIGESVDLFRRHRFPVPKQFHRYMYYWRGYESDLRWSDRQRVKRNRGKLAPIKSRIMNEVPRPEFTYSSNDAELHADLRKQTGYDLEKESVKRIYIAFQSSMENNLSAQTRQSGSLLKFFQNMKISISISLILVGLGLLGGLETRSQSAIILIIVPIFIPYLYMMFAKSEIDYFTRMMVDLQVNTNHSG